MAMTKREQFSQVFFQPDWKDEYASEMWFGNQSPHYPMSPHEAMERVDASFAAMAIDIKVKVDLRLRLRRSCDIHYDAMGKAGDYEFVQATEYGTVFRNSGKIEWSFTFLHRDGMIVFGIDRVFIELPCKINMSLNVSDVTVDKRVAKLKYENVHLLDVITYPSSIERKRIIHAGQSSMETFIVAIPSGHLNVIRAF